MSTAYHYCCCIYWQPYPTAIRCDVHVLATAGESIQKCVVGRWNGGHLSVKRACLSVAERVGWLVSARCMCVSALTRDAHHLHPAFMRSLNQCASGEVGQSWTFHAVFPQALTRLWHPYGNTRTHHVRWALVRESALRAWRGSSMQCPRITIVERNKDVGGCIKTHYGPGVSEPCIRPDPHLHATDTPWHARANYTYFMNFMLIP